MRKTTSGACLVLIAVLGGTCVGCGSSTKVDVASKNTTVGQELQDLEDARDRGLITEDEYQKQRRRIMEGK